MSSMRVTTVILAASAIVAAFACRIRLDESAVNANTTTQDPPTSCFEMIYNDSEKLLNRDGAIALCGGTDDAAKTVACFRKARGQLKLSTSASISLCSKKYLTYPNGSLGN